MNNWFVENWHWVAVAALALLIIMGIVIYNRLVILRTSARQAFADIDTQLKARADLIPNLVNTVKAYATHERETIVQLSQARSAAQSANGASATAMADNLMTAALGRLFAVSEAYPELKANANFMQLQHEFSDIENKLAAARRYLNSSVAEYNASIEQFPTVLVAKACNFGAEEMFTLGAARDAHSSAPVAAF